MDNYDIILTILEASGPITSHQLLLLAKTYNITTGQYIRIIHHLESVFLLTIEVRRNEKDGIVTYYKLQK